MSQLFNIEPIEENPSGLTCRTCENRERHLCGATVFQYCGVRKSNRTSNGLLKIKVTLKACQVYKPIIK